MLDRQAERTGSSIEAMRITSRTPFTPGGARYTAHIGSRSYSGLWSAGLDVGADATVMVQRSGDSGANTIVRMADPNVRGNTPDQFFSRDITGEVLS